MKHKKLFSLLLALVLSLSASTPVLASDELDLEALWVANTVKITFDSNDGRVAPDTQVYPYGEPRSLPGVCAMVKPGFTFLGWSTSKTATTPDWGPGDTSTKAFGYADETKAVAKTLYAVWGEDTSSGGHGSYTTSSYTKGTTVQGSGYVYVIPATSGAITITIDSTPAMTYNLTTSQSSSLPNRTSSLSGGGTFGTHSGGTYYYSEPFTFSSTSGTISGGSVSYTRTLSEPFTVPFTESICVNGAGVSSAVLFLEE